MVTTAMSASIGLENSTYTFVKSEYFVLDRTKSLSYWDRKFWCKNSIYSIQFHCFIPKHQWAALWKCPATKLSKYASGMNKLETRQKPMQTGWDSEAFVLIV
jgi:hypothetical protein